MRKMISVKIASYNKSENPYWVPKDIFDKHFCQDDFNDRIAKVLDDSYSEQWFRKSASVDGLEAFEFPLVAFHKRGEKLISDFIGTRHRTAVLFLHLNEIPINFCYSDAALRKLKQLDLRPVPLGETVQIPDLDRYDRPDEQQLESRESQMRDQNTLPVLKGSTTLLDFKRRAPRNGN